MDIFANFTDQAKLVAYDYDSWARSYDSSLSEHFTYEAHRKVAQAARLHAGPEAMHILDLATGTGLVLQELKPAFARATMTGLDASRNMLEQQRGKGLGSTLIHCDLQAGEWNIKKNHFDVITCAGALSLIKDLDHFLDQTRRAAATGATLAFSFLVGSEKRKDHICLEKYNGIRIYERSVEDMSVAVERHGFRLLDTPECFTGYAGRTFRETHAVIAFTKD